MKIEISIQDDHIDGIIENIESLVGRPQIIVDLKAVKRDGAPKREYLKSNLRYIVKEFLKKAGENKEFNRYNNDLKLVQQPQPVTIPEVEVL